MKSFKEFIKESAWKQYAGKSVKQIVEGIPADYNGFNGIPHSVATTDSIESDQLAPVVIQHNGSKWFHGGRISINPYSGERLYQYVKDVDPKNADVDTNSVWADANGVVSGSNYPASVETPAKESVKTK